MKMLNSIQIQTHFALSSFPSLFFAHKFWPFEPQIELFGGGMESEEKKGVKNISVNILFFAHPVKLDFLMKICKKNQNKLKQTFESNLAIKVRQKLRKF